ncbi:MAG TPA: roadblock/LC7 domain-containing protein [Anaerolineae bacterium]|nr:roadblock/LC7 domain-containing protein [Anaerolineae bacterium]
MSIDFSILEGDVSATAHRLERVLTDLAKDRSVDSVVLSTVDGLVIQAAPAEAGRLAAVAGFVTAAARQAAVLLSFSQVEQITIEMERDNWMVCQLFPVSGTQLILTVIFTESVAYKRLLGQVIRELKAEIED